MPQQIVYTDEIEDLIVEKFADLWNKSKAETIKTIIREFDKLDKKLKQVKKDDSNIRN